MDSTDAQATERRLSTTYEKCVVVRLAVTIRLQ